MQIKFPEKIISTDFENILKRYYYKSKFKKNQNIEYDFTNTTWFGIFELSLISLWIKELLDLKKEIIVCFPNKLKTHNFLIDYKFDKFLMDNKIQIKANNPFKSIKKPYKLFNKVFYPLTFFDEDIFNDILDDLTFGNRMEIIFDEIKDTEIIKSGAIRDIVLNELGSNIFIHSKTNFGNLIMTKYSAYSSNSKDKWKEKYVSRYSTYEKIFIEKLGGEPYLELIISDKGIGILKTLIQAYHDDDIIVNKVEDPTEKIILEYSFLYRSTCRTVEEREGDIYNIISQETKKYPSPTGLYRLKDIVKYFHGFLYMRSGSSIICYDFYENQSYNKPETNRENKLTPFGGTQFKLLFPLKAPRKKETFTTPYYQSSLENYKEKPLYSELIILKNYIKSEKLYSIKEQAKFLRILFDEIEKRKQQLRGRQSCLIIDGLKDIKISHKAQHYLIYEAMNRQGRGDKFAILITNVNLDILSLQKDFVKPRKMFSRALALFNERREPYFLGLNENEKEIVNNIVLKNREHKEEVTKKFVSENGQLFTYNQSENNYSFIFTHQRINNLLKNGLMSEIKKIILDDNSFIFHEEIKVLLPSKLYCKGYFEIYKLVDDITWRDIIVSYFMCILLENKPEFIISITSHCGDIIDAALDNLLKVGFNLKPIHLNFSTPIYGYNYAKIIFNIDQGKTGIIITDVIGSGKTIKSILENCPDRKITNIFSFVDATGYPESHIVISGFKIPIDSIVKQKLDYYKQLPMDWEYREIHIIDPETNILIFNPIKSIEPIWKEISDYNAILKGKKIQGKHNNFLDEVVQPIGGFEYGHFISGDKHLVYLFNIPKISRYFLKEITDLIVKNTEEFISRIPTFSKITHVLYPSFNPGLQEIAYQVSCQFKKSTPLAIDYEQFITPYDQEEPKPGIIEGALLIDDAIFSGESIYRFLDIVERKGAKYVFIFVLIKRGSEYNIRKIKKTRLYGQSQVIFNYLSEAQLPVYSNINCPICYKLKELFKLTDSIMAYDNLKKLVDFIKIKISKISPRNVEEVIGESILTSEEGYNENNNARLNFRWKLEMAITNLGVRNELSTIASDFDNPSQNVLALLNVIAKEKLYFLLNDKIRNVVFYDTFRNNIISACKFYINKIGVISEEDLESIIEILNEFDSDFLINSLSSLFELEKLGEEKFFQVCIQLLLSQKAKKYPSRIISALDRSLEKIKKRVAIYSIKRATCIGLLSYWKNFEKNLTNSIKENLDIFKELQGSIFHTINQSLIFFRFDIQIPQFDTSEIKSSWGKLYNEINELIRMVRNFIGINKNHELVFKIEESVNRLEIQKEYCEKIILNLCSRELNELNIDKIEFSKSLEKSYERIEILIFGEDGIIKLLDNFVTDIRTIIQQNLTRFSIIFYSKGIQVEESYDEGSCLVFGHQYDIHEICQNLIENVEIHSGANLLKVSLKIDNDKELIKMEILDNGIGFKEPLEFKVGLNVVQDKTKFCNGSFKIERITLNSESYTRATIILPLIKERLNIWIKE